MVPALDKHIGELVEITFLDCAWGDEKDLMVCHVYGELIEVTDKKVLVRAWHTVNSDNNDEYAVIVRSTVTGVVRLKRVK